MTLGKLFNFTVSQFPPHNKNATFTKLLSMHIKHLQVNTHKALDSVWLIVNAIKVWVVTIITIYYYDCYHYCFYCTMLVQCCCISGQQRRSYFTYKMVLVISSSLSPSFLRVCLESKVTNVKAREHVCVLSCVQLFATSCTVSRRAPLSTGFLRQGYWSGLPFPPPGDLPHPGIEPMSPESPALAGRCLTTESPGKSM